MVLCCSTFEPVEEAQVKKMKLTSEMMMVVYEKCENIAMYLTTEKTDKAK